MDEIKVGEWVRTVDGHIYIIDKEKKNLEIIEFMNVDGNKKILKHSSKIIDLIQERRLCEWI